MNDSNMALVLINPRAGIGQGDVVRSILSQALEQYGWSVNFQTLEKGVAPAVVGAFLRESATMGASLVVAAGGDGTISLVAEAIIQSELKERLRLGVFPSGTANSIARELGMPIDWTEAAHLIGSMKTSTALDAMKMNGRYYFLRIGIGLDAEVIRDTSREEKRRLGRWAYVKTLLGKHFFPHRHRYYCLMDGQKKSFKAVQVFIANGGQIALAPFRIGPDIAFDDGVLDVCAYDVHFWWHYFQVAWRLFRRDYAHQPQMRFWTIRQSITIASKHPRNVHGDGEPCGRTPVTIELVPAALRVIAVTPTAF